MAHELNHLMERVFNTPHLCTDAKLDAIAVILCRSAGMNVDAAPAALLDKTGREQDSPDTGPMKIENGVAEIPVRGTMTHRVSGLRPYSGMVGYNQIADMMDIAKADASVRHIAFAIDTHGGEATGAFDLHDFILAQRGNVPMTAVVAPTALSAGYLLACACDQVIVPEFGHVGSIGVVMRCRNLSGLMAKEGIQDEYIYAGKHKIDGAPNGPLTPEARAEFQKDVDALYSAFVSRVATARHISEKAVADTQALIYFGRDAIGNALADKVSTERDAMMAIRESAKPRTFFTVPDFTLGSTTKG
jgi:signal peptide peptidase SppA